MPPVSGDTVFRLFMPNQHRIDSGTSDSSQAKPAFWIHVGVPAAILPKIQPLSFASVIGSPPNAPNSAHRHHQRDDDLHARHAEVAEARR